MSFSSPGFSAARHSRVEWRAAESRNTAERSPTRAMAENIHNVTAANFRDIVLEGSRSVPVLVDFWADWCQPCRMLTPILAKLADEYRDKLVLAKVNTEAERDLAAHFGVRSLPTVKLFRNGQVADEFLGALPESEIRAFLDRHIPRESDAVLARALQRAQQGDLRGAIQMVRQAQAADPGNHRALFALARLQAVAGELEAAEKALSELPAAEQSKPEVTALRAQIRLERQLAGAPSAEQLAARLATDPADSEVQYQLALRKALARDYEGALELLMTLMMRDRAYGDDAARKAMLEVFDALGGAGDLVKRYRSRLFNILH